MNEWNIPGRFDFSIPEAQRLSDLTSVESDLEAVIRICSRCERILPSLARIPGSEPTAWMDDLEALGDLMFAAVIRYGRTIATGVRQSIPKEWIDGLSEEDRAAHAYFKALRDKYVAHSVSQLEDNQVFVMLTPQFGDHQQPEHIVVDKGHRVTLGSDELMQLRSLAEALRAIVLGAIETEKVRLLEIARQMPTAKIKERGTESIPVPGKHEAFVARKSFR